MSISYGRSWMLRRFLDQDCWEYLTKLHMAVLLLLVIAISTATISLFAAPTRWLGAASLLLAAAGSYQSRIADDFLEQQAHFWDTSKFPHGPPSVWMRNVTMDESTSWRARARRQLFQNPNIGNCLIAMSTAIGIVAIFS